MYKNATPAARPDLFVVPTNSAVIAASKPSGTQTAIIPNAKILFRGILSTTKSEMIRADVDTRMIPTWKTSLCSASKPSPAKSVGP